MSFRRTAVAFSSALLATVLLLSTAAAVPRVPRPVGPFCRAARPRALCTQMTGGAATWSDAMTNAIKATIGRVRAAKPVADTVRTKLPGDLMPESRDSIDSTCREAYDRILFELGQCIGFVKNDPTSALKTYLSSMTYFDCRFALEEFMLTVPEVNQFDQELIKLSGIMLAILEQKPK